MLLIGSLLNASSVASFANHLKNEKNMNITVIPCGEVWNDLYENEDSLRPSIEDYLGAGAILSELEGTKSPEAEVCIGAFLQSKHKLKELIWECGSGRELRMKGFEDDVRHCSQLNHFKVVPILQNNCFVNGLEIEKG